MKVTFENEAGQALLTVEDCKAIPRKNERVFIDDNLHKVKKVIHWFGTNEGHTRVDIILRKL